MGRASKFHTIEERHSGRKAASKAYSAANRSQLCERKRALYRKSRSRKGTPYINKDTAIQSLPTALLALASEPLPTSPLFLEASESADNLDESEITQFDGDPPYVAQPPSTEPDGDYLEKMLDVMSGRRARHERQRDAEMECKSHECIERELIDELGEWEALATILETYKASASHNAMARNRLWWRARIVNNLFVAASKIHARGSGE
ncbi:hypothetical protein PLEOSDRAFT_159000 [Pleurotus ostreatus PC15]|uniref:Uncharacterized protein n=1 Tax=Pleurotus ostreatus (strain PC15) TaxID=1137138 RepID=A0A067NSL3_PLEO1|nr:hypothetical protein PLEOSDRAFT_159000 [Pleurotus ostreatus PC15]